LSLSEWRAALIRKVSVSKLGGEAFGLLLGAGRRGWLSGFLFDFGCRGGQGVQPGLGLVYQSAFLGLLPAVLTALLQEFLPLLIVLLKHSHCGFRPLP